MSSAVDIGQRRAVVIVQDLQMIYKIGSLEVPALRGVDIAVKEGEFVAVMGPSGCGKSTLLHLIGGLLRPTAGKIYIEGIDISLAPDAVRTEVRRKEMGFVFQSFNLLSTLTVRGNIELARRIYGSGNEEEGVQKILNLLGLKDKISHKPSELSGGEQQRVAIARAVINRPSLLLADEPTGNLDTLNSKMVLDVLQELNVKYGQTIIMITHNPEAAATANRTIQMQDGRVLGQVQDFFYAREEKRL